MSDKLQQALQLHRNQQLNEAHQLYSELLNEAPSPEVVYLISLVAIQINKHLDAINLITHAVRMSPQEPLYLFAMGFLAQEMHWKDQCIEAYQKAVVLRPDFTEAMTNLAFAYTEYNDYEQALRCYRTALRLNPQAYPAYVGLAITLSRMGLTKDALDTLDIALTVRPDIAQDGETPKATLTRLESAKPLLYQPPITVPNTPKPAANTSARVKKEKPILRIIHQLPMSGGSVIARSVAVLPEVTLFDNIHPLNQQLNRAAANIFAQANNWYHLFSDADKQALQGKSVNYAEGVRLIYDRLAERGKTMVVRSWSLLDFISSPIYENVERKLALNEALQEHFEIRQIATTRHPIENWVSLKKLQLMRSLTLDRYMEGYEAFATFAEQMGYIRREDFGDDPDATLQQLCKQLDIPFDPVYRNRWKFEPHIEAEADDGIEHITKAPTDDHPQAILEDFEANMHYWSVLKRLGYTHPESATAGH